MKNLNKLYYLKLEIDNLKIEIDNLTEISSSKISGMPSGKSASNPTEQFLLKKEKLLDKLNKKLEKYIDELTEIENIIDNIEDVEVKAIARFRFIDNLKWEDISKKMHMDRTVCYKKLKKFLKNKEV
jgi:translation initiation factor 2 beta subunit (eIF-2beta)/eIF-5